MASGRGNFRQPLGMGRLRADHRAMTDAALQLHPDRLLPADPTTRGIARRLYASVRDLPIISPHGHVPPGWIAQDVPFGDPTSLLISPDHYVTRLLHAHGISLDSLGAGGAPLSPDAARGSAGSPPTPSCSSGTPCACSSRVT